MATVEVQKIPTPTRKLTKRELYATVCYYYKQYTLQEVEEMPARDIQLLLKTVNRLEASNLLNLTQIAAAPHTKNGQGVKNLIDKFKDWAK